MAFVLQVVQVYTYMVNPLGVGNGNGDGGPQQHKSAAGGPAAPTAGPAAADAGKTQQQTFSKITGWELRIVMEYCNSVSARCVVDKLG